MRFIDQKNILALGLILLLGQAGWNSFLISRGDVFWWYDMALHFLGGMMVAMMLLYYGERWPDYIQLPNNVFARFLFVLSFVAIIGIFWEFYEYAADYVFKAFDLTLSDTLSDLLLDLLGAGFVASIAAFFKR